MQVKTPIPKLMRIGQKKYSIEVVEAMLEKSWKGAVNYDKRHIRVGQRSNLTGKPFTSEQVDETFWHEVTHAILYDMDNSLYRNERFVNEFSKRLAQAIKTARF